MKKTQHNLSKPTQQIWKCRQCKQKPCCTRGVQKTGGHLRAPTDLHGKSRLLQVLYCRIERCGQRMMKVTTSSALYLLTWVTRADGALRSQYQLCPLSVSSTCGLRWRIVPPLWPTDSPRKLLKQMVFQELLAPENGVSRSLFYSPAVCTVKVLVPVHSLVQLWSYTDCAFP